MASVLSGSLPTLSRSQLLRAAGLPPCRHFSSRSRLCSSRPAIFAANAADIYPFGVPSDDPSQAWFRGLSLTIGDSDAWAVLSRSSSSATRANLLSTILHRARYSPTRAAGHPILATLPRVQRPAQEGGDRDRTVEDLIQVVSFKTRLGSTGGFDDYTARYYSIRDEDKLTLLEHLDQTTDATIDEIIETAKLLRLGPLLNLPLITLSNGQTRRARILRALVAKPELVILEEPFTGLDVASRDLLVTLLSTLHARQSPRILLVLRPQDALPEFVTHIALADVTNENSSNPITFGTRSEILATAAAREMMQTGEHERRALEERKRQHRDRVRDCAPRTDRRTALVELSNVNVVYGASEGQAHGRVVLQDVNWTIRKGDRWVLAGHNGSGKSTLLSIVLGDHPRSFTQEVTLFDKPRYRQATATIQQNIGHVSPEIFNAFPRRHGEQGLTVYDAIVTGFESIYSYRKATAEQAEAIDTLLERFQHPLLTPSFLSRLFASLTPGEQALVLLLRALVKRPRLLVLDEPFQGMDEPTIRAAQHYLAHELDPDQAVILISHFEEEIPDVFNRRIELEAGKVKEMI
ncbi:uncharacterized protein JCM15063_003561 [Sporobolomyces koalae]|uniref:uncharacterized protein n=1 Tax=Sporobolomyces koalae TaxID=500713 RepID=UPI003178FFAB